MMEIRLQVPDALVEKFQQAMDPGASITDIAIDALTLSSWAMDFLIGRGWRREGPAHNRLH